MSLQIFTQQLPKTSNHRRDTEPEGADLEFKDSLGAFRRLGGDRVTLEAAGLSVPNRRHVAIVDRSALLRDCLKLALAQQPRRWRVTDVENAVDLVRLLRQGVDFSVVLLGAATSWQIDLVDLAMVAAAAGETPILAVAECDDAERARMILQAGAKGFVPMSHGLKVLVAALERLRTGGTFVPLVLTESNGNCASPDANKEYSPRRVLTRRQRDVLALISEGRSNKLIADALGMSESTVKAHVKQIIRRLNVVNRTQAALIATRAAREIPVPRAAMLEGVL
jgi:DNA-binding NarL/FixJ family response regulator